MLDTILTHVSESDKKRILKSLFSAKSFEAFMLECSTFINSQPARLVADLSKLRLEGNKRMESISKLAAHARRTTNSTLRTYMEAIDTLRTVFKEDPTMARWHILETHSQHCLNLLNEMQGGDFADEIALVALETLQEELAKDAEALVKKIGKTNNNSSNDKVSSVDVHQHDKFIKTLEKAFKIVVHHFEPVNEGVFVYIDEENNDDLLRQLSTLEDRLDKITDQYGYVMLRKGTIDDIRWGSYPNGLAKWMFIKVDLTGEPASKSMPDLKDKQEKGKKLKNLESVILAAAASLMEEPLPASGRSQTRGQLLCGECGAQMTIGLTGRGISNHVTPDGDVDHEADADHVAVSDRGGYFEADDEDHDMSAHIAATRSAGEHDTADALEKHARKDDEKPDVVMMADPEGSEPKGPMDLTSQIMDYEAGEMDETEIAKLFQHLIDTGLCWSLQGHYGRTAHSLITAGICHPPGPNGTAAESIPKTPPTPKTGQRKPKKGKKFVPFKSAAEKARRP